MDIVTFFENLIDGNQYIPKEKKAYIKELFGVEHRKALEKMEFEEVSMLVDAIAGANGEISDATSFIAKESVKAEKRMQMDQARRAEQRGESVPGTNSKRDFFNAAVSSFLASKITEQLLDDVRERHPGASEETVFLIAAEQIANEIIDRDASPEDRKTLQESDIAVAIGEKAAQKSLEAANYAFKGKGKIAKSEVLKSFVEFYGDFAKEISQKYDLTTEEGRSKAIRAYLFDDSYSQEERDAISGFLFDVESLYYRSKGRNTTTDVPSNDDKKIYEDSIDLDEFNHQKVEHAREVKEQIISLTNNTIDYDNEDFFDTYYSPAALFGKARIDYQEYNDVKATLNKQNIQIDNIEKGAPEGSEYKGSLGAKKAVNKSLGARLAQMSRDQNATRVTTEKSEGKPLAQKSSSQKTPAISPIPSISTKLQSQDDAITQDEFKAFVDIEGEDMPTKKEDAVAVFESSEESMFDLDEIDTSNKAPYSPKEHDSDEGVAPKSREEDDFVEAVTEKAVEEKPAKVAEVVQEVVEETGELEEGTQEKGPIKKSLRERLTSFVNLFIKKQKTLGDGSGQRQETATQGQDQEANIKKNSESFLSRALKAVGLKKEEPQVEQPQQPVGEKPAIEKKVESFIEKVDVNPLDAVNQTNSSSGPNKDDPNKPKNIDEETPEQ